MNFTLMPSLKKRTLIKITIELWNRCSNADLVEAGLDARNPSFTQESKMHLLKNEVTERVPKLPLPESLKREILDFILPIGLEILEWMWYHSGNYLGIDMPAELFWTPQGTVERKKTAEVLVKDESIDIISRYRLACIYCLEEDIKELWNAKPEIKNILNKGNPGLHEEYRLVGFWTFFIKGEVAKFYDILTESRGSLIGNKISPFQIGFELSVLDKIKAATEYFFEKLPGEKKEYLVNCAKHVVNEFYMMYIKYDLDHLKGCAPDVFCFILSQMNEDQQVKVFQRYLFELLKLLLGWPWQCFFMKTANRTWNFLPERKFESLLGEIVRKINRGYKDYNYHKVFGEFWQQSPESCKKYVIGRCASQGFLLLELFEIEDKENLRLIFKNATLKEREEMIFTCIGKSICKLLVYSNKWDLIKFFVQECISSDDIMIKFKEELEEDLTVNARRNFSQLLDNLVHKNGKKGLMEEETSK